MLSIRVVKDIIDSSQESCFIAMLLSICFLYILIQDTSHCLAIVHVTGQIQLFLLLWKQIGLLNCLNRIIFALNRIIPVSHKK